MFGLGVGEILIILAAALIFIGPKKLPEIARGLGKGFKEFQNAARGITETLNEPARKANEFKSELKKEMPDLSQFKDDPPHENPGEDFVSSADLETSSKQDDEGHQSSDSAETSEKKA